MSLKFRVFFLLHNVRIVKSRTGLRAILWKMQCGLDMLLVVGGLLYPLTCVAFLSVQDKEQLNAPDTFCC